MKKQQQFRKKPCKNCRQVFQPTHPCHLYCSPECAHRGWRSRYYERNYGLTVDAVETMLAEQGGRCHLCGSPGFLMDPSIHEAALAVDHCHSTGTVRKLLCHNCNRALGLLQDSPELLRKAADYIVQFREGATTIPLRE